MSNIYFQACGNFLSSSEQIINPNKPIIFEKCHNICNIDFENETGYIKILNSGIYIINLSAQFINACQIVLYINNYSVLSTLTSSKSGIINIHQVIRLNHDDTISFRNYDSLLPITTITYKNNLTPQSKNINFNIFEISSMDIFDEPCRELSCDDYFNDSTISMINQK